MNLNKLAPRLTISAKLAIAFALLTVVPLAVVAGITTPMAISQLRRGAQADLEYDVELMAVRVSRSIREANQHLSFLIDATVGGRLAEDSPGDARRVQELAAMFLRSDSSAVFRFKAIDADGELQFEAGPNLLSTDHSNDVRDDADDGLELYYAWRAESLETNQRLFLPVELRAVSDPESGFGVTPAVAIMESIRAGDGSYLGVAVAEASASTLFRGLELTTPGLPGDRALVDRHGFFLYHSEYKRDWASLLTNRAERNLSNEFSPEVSNAILTGEPGTINTDGNEIVSFRPIGGSGEEGAALMLYRTVPLGTIGASVRRFLLVTGSVGAGILTLVLGIAVVAAKQFTKPIYALQRAARRLAQHGEAERLVIETNDELEDLAHDFTVMAAALVVHRRQLETQVEARTRALQTTRAELTEIVKYAADAIIGLDPHGYVRLWNDGAATMFGYEEAEVVGKHIDDLIGVSGTASQHEAAYIRRMLDQSGSVVNLRTMRAAKDGSSFPVSLTQTSITDGDGRFLGSSLIVRDNRMASKLEEQMRQSERLAAVSIMAAGLAHELNNPLAILGNRIELMEREASRQSTNGQLVKDLAVLGQHVGRLREITTDLLAFARDDSEAIEPVSVDLVAARIGRLLESTFVARGVTLEFEERPNVPPIPGNEKAIETVVVNLLMNAMQATPAGGRVCVDISQPDLPANTVRIEISDTGKGVPPDVRDRLFEPFVTTKDASEGTGLGLTVCRAIVERHFGKIWTEAVEGGGTRFIVLLPTLRETT